MPARQRGGRGKRRFGVSIPAELAHLLDRLSEALGRDRSSLVAEALESFVHDHIHGIVPHRCRGILIAASDSPGAELPVAILSKYQELIKAHLHIHLGGQCVNILVLEGFSDKIAALYSEIASLPKAYNVRYVPLRSLITPLPVGGDGGGEAGEKVEGEREDSAEGPRGEGLQDSRDQEEARDRRD